ncbi:Alanine racemase [hydrothermal vent metagenome]|uniref:alanine racemase n=1 Tax=hydrothermal vent metagenome TaxID=652676 RepID=A0A3B0ZM18_9ZZZZ
MIPAVEASISCSALKHNLERVRQQAAQSQVMAIIKANAYGHGLLRTARALIDADAFGVARLAEGIELREQGITQPVVLLAGVMTLEELALAAQYQLDLVVHQEMQLELLAQWQVDEPCFNVWIKLDTGMHRLGLATSQLDIVLKRLATCKAVTQSVSLMTHFSSADELDKPQTSDQISRFHHAIENHNKKTSLANSAAILAWPQSHAHWVRPGIMLYGVSPFENSTAHEHDLQPVMTLKTSVMAINQVAKGEAIGYGATWHCPETMPVGIIAIGYGDGYPRHIKLGTPVLINGLRVPIIGRVSMDTMCVDLRHCSDVKIGDTVTLWGEGLPVEEIARCAGTIAYELLCQLTPRVQFVEV